MVKGLKETRALTVEEQKCFFKITKGTSNYNQYALILQTGLRIGELIGLRWSDVDIKIECFMFARTMEYRYSSKEWTIESLKPSIV